MTAIPIQIFLITALTVNCIYGSNITNNEVTTTGIVPPVKDNNAADLKLQPETNADTGKNVDSQQSLRNNVSSSSVESSESMKENAITNENASSASFNDLTNEAVQVPAKDNAINLFTRQVSHSIFHNALEYPSSGPDTADKNQVDLPKPKTLIWSPFSVYQALVPLFYAAGGQTKEELGQLLLARAKPQDNLNNNATTDESSFPDLNDVLHNGKTFSSATGLFVRHDVPLNLAYAQEVKKELKSVELKEADFGHPVEAVMNINTWVNDSTQGLMSKAVDETQLDPDMFMLIVNCVQFKASWKTRFASKLTKVVNFYGVSGVQKVPMMKQIGTQRFAKFPIMYSNDYERQPGFSKDLQVPFSVLEMPYADESMVSLFILPESTEKLQATMDYVDKVGVAGIRQMLHDWDVEVLMPKFRVKSDVNLQEALVENGLKTLFNPVKANLTKMMDLRRHIPPTSANNDTSLESSKSPKYIPPPFLSNIIHRTVFETTEEGTTAAALTALSIVPLSALSHDRVYRFNLNRPFIVLLVKTDNTIVFQGVIADLIGQDVDISNSVGKTHMDGKELSKIPSRNSIIYPTDSEIKAELEKLLSSKGEENKQVVNEPTDLSQKATMPGQNTDSQSSELNATYDSEDRAWWIPKRIPEYLLPNATSTLNSSDKAEQPTKNTEKESVPEQTPPQQTQVPVQAAAPVPEKIPLIQFSKYQQPEPKDPNGIRFPATIPLSRNKVNIKPRFENYEIVKNPLFRWMAVY